jgi:hypothetical protein
MLQYLSIWQGPLSGQCCPSPFSSRAFFLILLFLPFFFWSDPVGSATVFRWFFRKRLDPFLLLYLRVFLHLILRFSFTMFTRLFDQGVGAFSHPQGFSCKVFVRYNLISFFFPWPVGSFITLRLVHISPVRILAYRSGNFSAFGVERRGFNPCQPVRC